ncbi:hypothetical protein LTR17_022736 [Elasticomyces elasticus]|nr:hypothetical protein LTR17_022736 [Elasticomyces elasticus]
MNPSFNATILTARELGFSSTKNLTCARPLPNEVGEPIFGSSSLTFHLFMVYVCAGCLGITILSTAFLNWRHLHSFTVPQEQRQIIRIANLPAVYAIFAFLGVCFPMDYQYIEPIAGIYEAFCVAALLLLGIEYVCPDGTDREAYFSKLPGRDKKGEFIEGGSLVWFQRTWAMVLQYPLSKTVLVVIQIVTQIEHVYCENSFSPKYAHLYLTLVDYFFVGGALGAAIKFYQRMGRKEKAISIDRGSKAKIWSFLGVLVFQILQDIIFGLLNGKLFEPSAKLTYNDINFGIPAFLTCVESVIFSLLFHWSYSSKEYHEGGRIDRLGGVAQRTKTFSAILDALNPSDIIAGVVTSIGLLFMRVQSKYGARSAPQPEKLRESDVGMEPLSYRSRMRGYSGGSEGGDQSPPFERQYDSTLHTPAMPQSARGPSSVGGGKDRFRPSMSGQEYQPLTRSRDPSPNGMGAQYPRPMV